MSRKYSLAHLTTLGLAPPDMIYLAAAAGYDYVGIRPILMGVAGEQNYALAEKPEMLKATKRALDETGVKLHDIELARIREDLDIAAYEPAMAAGAELGAKCLLCSIWTADKAYYTAKFGELCDMAARFGLGVALEFVTFAGAKDLQAVKDVIAAANRPNASYMIDTLHFSRSRVDLAEQDGIPPEMFKMAHICDAPAEMPAMDDKDALIHTARDARLYIGEGGIDMAAIIGKLPPDTVLSLELPHLARVAEYGYAEHIRRCLTSAKQYFG